MKLGGGLFGNRYNDQIRRNGSSLAILHEYIDKSKSNLDVPIDTDLTKQRETIKAAINDKFTFKE